MPAPALPQVSIQSRIVAALAIVVLVTLWIVNDDVRKISQMMTFVSEDCALINDRSYRTELYLRDGVLIDHRFAIAWRSRGYGDIADAWEALATRDRERFLTVQTAPSVTRCSSVPAMAPTPELTLPPIALPTMDAMPPTYLRKGHGA